MGLVATTDVSSQLKGAWKSGIEQYNRQTEENRIVLGRILTKHCGRLVVLKSLPAFQDAYLRLIEAPAQAAIIKN